jgi:gamma-carbonic anhydrase
MVIATVGQKIRGAFGLTDPGGAGPLEGMSKATFGLSGKFVETISRNIRTAPCVAADAYIAPDATLVANVEIGPEASVWPQAVLRGDVAHVALGAQSNVQDGAVVHTADDLPAIIGRLVTVGHRAVVHACTVEDEVLVGMGAIILDGAQVGARSIIGAHATVTQRMKIPPGSMVLGTPAKVVRSLSEAEQEEIKMWALRYVRLSREYLSLRG